MSTLQVWAGRALIAAAAMSLMPVQADAADDMAYMGTVSGQFGTLDLATGTFTQLGSSGQTLAGFGVANGEIYASSYHTAGQLFTVNRANGSLTPVGNSAIDYDDFGSTTAGLYAVGTDDNLYSINAGNGSAHLIGSIGIAFGSWRSLSTAGSALYFANGANLYTINTSTAAATLVGNMGGPEIGAMAFVDGKLYGGVDSPALQVATLDIGTGLANVGPALSGTSSAFYAMTPFVLTTAVPEPQAPWLLLAGLTLLASRRRLPFHWKRSILLAPTAD